MQYCTNIRYEYRFTCKHPVVLSEQSKPKAYRIAPLSVKKGYFSQ